MKPTMEEMEPAMVWARLYSQTVMVMAKGLQPAKPHRQMRRKQERSTGQKKRPETHPERPGIDPKQTPVSLNSLAWTKEIDLKFQCDPNIDHVGKSLLRINIKVIAKVPNDRVFLR